MSLDNPHAQRAFETATVKELRTVLVIARRCVRITYTRADESGSSLRAAGWHVVAERPSRGGWHAPSRPRDDIGTSGVARQLWEKAT